MRLAIATDSVEAWDDFFYVFLELVVAGRTVTRRQLLRRQRQTVVQAPRQGSWEIVIAFILTQALGPYLHKGADKLRRELWKKLQELIETYRIGKDNAASARDLVEPFRRFLREAAMNMISEDEDLYQTVVLIDELLDTATAPLDEEAEELTLSSAVSKKKIILNREFRELVAEPLELETDQPIEDIMPVEVRFVRLNLKTGRGLINVRYPDVATDTQQYCLIEDERLHSPRNPYSQAFNDVAWIEVQAQRMRPSEQGKNTYWRIVDGKSPPTTGYLF